MQVYQRKETCFGCRACEKMCPLQCIVMKPDEEGFLYPVVNHEECVECGMCVEACNAKKIEKHALKKSTYVAYAKDDETRIQSSSGGVFGCLARYVIECGGVVFGAALDDTLMVSHIAVDSIEQLSRLRGSKYVQSDTANTYVEAKELLERGIKVLYSGTPCQIDGLKKYLDKDYENLVSLSIICFGVPSPLVWKRYLKFLEGNFGEKIDEISFRKKKYDSWREYGLLFRIGENEYFCDSAEDPFMKGFQQGIFLRPSCYNCKMKKVNCSSDIMLGDFWGIEKYHQDIDAYKGVSAVMIGSGRGQELFEQIRDFLFVKESSYEEVLAGNPMIEHSVVCSREREKFWEELNASGRIWESIQNNVKNIPMRKEERFAYMYPILLKYTQNISEGKLITRELTLQGINRVALYAVTELTDLLVMEYENNELIEVVGIADRNYLQYCGRYSSCSVFSVDELLKNYEANRIDGIVVCSPIHANTIIDSLHKKGISYDKIFTIMELIY